MDKLVSEIPYDVMKQDELIAELQRQGVKNFIDPQFPPRDSSIYDSANDEYPYANVVQWRRPKDFMGANANIQLFDEGIDPNDIKQGALADCWILSAAACLAERPKLIDRLFITKEYNEMGIYKLRLCKNGEWVVITIDDYIPCFYNGGPMFSRSTGKEIWVLLLEKAYAKLHGHYYSL